MSKPTIKNNPLDVLSGIVNLEAVEQAKAETHPGRPTIPEEEKTANLDRATFILEAELSDWLKDWAWVERMSITEAVNKMFREYLADKPREDEHGNKRPIPAKRLHKNKKG